MNQIKRENGASDAESGMPRSQQAKQREQVKESEDTELLPDNDLLDFEAF
jgi:hypothetical protein